MDRFKRRLCAALTARLQGRKARFPEGVGPLVDAFEALSRSRSYNAVGPNPITWEALAAWSCLMRRPIEPHHADIIMALDQTWLDHAYRSDKPTGVKTLPPISQQPLSAALFDAVVR